MAGSGRARRTREGYKIKIGMSSPQDCFGRARESADAQSARAKILMVDDDRDNLLALQAILEPLGQDLMLAESGMDALRFCLDHDFAAILLDVRMPEMDGFEAAELIRARPRSGDTPILFLTGYRSDEQLFRGYHLGAVDFLFKPIVPEVLQSKVAVFVELSRNHQLMRAQAEELRRTEQKFRAVLEGAPDAMLITTPEGVIELANSRTDSLFGYSRDEIIGMNISALIPEWGYRGSHFHSQETRLWGLRSDRTSFPAEITMNFFVAADARLVTTAVRDASVQVESEERIRQINAELERRVEDRTLALRRSNEALRQFAWAASHDLQEPTRTVVSYSQWLAKHTGGSLDDAATGMLRIIETNAERLNHLLAALRQYIVISESTNEAWIPVDCHVALQTALSNLENLIKETGAKIEAERLPVIPSEEIVLVQMFQNLVSNALKYRSTETPVVNVSGERQEGGWTFSVSDNGIGIDPTYFKLIFGVFKRLHGRDYAGTGMGLSICRAGVERLGGRIWVESAPGKGSTFEVLPAGSTHDIN